MLQLEDKHYSGVSTLTRPSKYIGQKGRFEIKSNFFIS